MTRVANSYESKVVRQTAIRLLLDQRLGGLRLDSAAYFPDDLRSNSDILIRFAYRHLSEVFGVSLQYPNSSEIKQMCEEAVTIAEKRRKCVLSTKKELAREGWELNLLSSPEKIVYLFGSRAVIFLTGRCGAGKSTLIKKIRYALAEHPLLRVSSKGLSYKPLAEVYEIDPDEFLPIKE